MKHAVWGFMAVCALAAPALADDDHDDDRDKRGHSSSHGLEFAAVLSSAQETGAVDSMGKARAFVRFDEGFTRMFVDVRIRNLTGSFAASHFHCNRPGINGPVVFGLQSPGPLTFDGEGLRGVLTNENFSGADCTGLIGRPVNNLAALALAMRDGLIYLNVHTDIYPPGEIRGQVLEVSDDD